MRDRDQISDKPVDTKRFWTAYWELEEYHAGMWRRVNGADRQIKLIAEAVSLLRNAKDFSHAVDLVMQKWPVSCRAEFTSPGNHLAWIGAAACCLSSGVPEELTRRAWWKLTEFEQFEANDVAKKALRQWRESHA